MPSIFSCLFPQLLRPKAPKYDTNLMDMPADCMNIILGHTWFEDIHTLRQVCHSLRTHIDATNPHPDVQFLDFSVQITATRVLLNYMAEKRMGDIKYEMKGDDCEVTQGLLYLVGRKRRERKVRKLVENQNYLNVFYNDFERLLKYHNQGVLGTLTLHIAPGLSPDVAQVMMRVLAAKPRPLQVRDIDIYTEAPEEFLPVLSLLDPREVESLTMKSGESEEKRILKLNLEKWTKLGHLDIDPWIVDVPPMSSFRTLWAASLHFETLSGEQMAEVVEIIRNKHRCRHLDFTFKTFENLEAFLYSLKTRFWLGRDGEVECFMEFPKGQITVDKGKNRIQLKQEVWDFKITGDDDVIDWDEIYRNLPEEERKYIRK
ncbi:hypothetical protein CRE_18168 [Caenorhabditis remanei]|uniref:DUF38 domain-containing protein n=1 Tax=Caenorhabditis remanei TaxID=31234 RepID=E3N8L6_CAERE|nr:hypothetical protein CRE_18168 [Caenorhabditis remanei]